MAYKVLGQAHLTTTSDTTVYTVPSGKEAVISTIVLANVTSSATTFDLAVRPDGTALAAQHYLGSAVPLAGNDSTTLTLGITADASDVVSVAAGAGSAISVSIFGSEITA